MATCADHNLSSAEFPSLDSHGFEKTSDATTDYNCIAWAIGENDRFWAPGYGLFMQYYWPSNVPFDMKLATLQQIYQTRGYKVCATGELEPGFEKVALYTKGDNVQHAARQLADGKWSSKLGSNIDISHDVCAVEGPAYGAATCFMVRAIGS